jgi:arylsulfatase B
MCTPSRSSLLTGKYPNKIGMHHYVIPNDSPYGLGLDQKIMPQYMKEAGYRTCLIGKWHLGFHKKPFTPTERGFDSFFGYLGGYIDYYDYTLKMFNRNYSRGYDMRKNLTVNYDIPEDTYATDLFTDEAVKTIGEHNYENPLFLYLAHLAPHSGNDDIPLQAPQMEIDKFGHIEDENRRVYAGNTLKFFYQYYDNKKIFFFSNGFQIR